jgi:excisionase family DNA binding protein
MCKGDPRSSRLSQCNANVLVSSMDFNARFSAWWAAEDAMDRLLLKPTEAGEILGLGRSKVYEMLANGELPVVRVGRSVRVPVEALREWVSRQTHPSHQKDR